LVALLTAIGFARVLGADRTHKDRHDHFCHMRRIAKAGKIVDSDANDYPTRNAA